MMQKKKINFRWATMSDLDRITALESICFPSNEADSLDMIRIRLMTSPHACLIVTVDDELVGFINGLPTSTARLTNEFYSMNPPLVDNADGIALMSLAIHPDFRRCGFGTELLNKFIDRAAADHKTFTVLVCKADKIGYYERFGFECIGVSAVTLGAATWHDMIANKI